mgnify:CR=1 FL=1
MLVGHAQTPLIAYYSCGRVARPFWRLSMTPSTSSRAARNHVVGVEPGTDAAPSLSFVEPHSLTRKMWLERKLMMSVKKTNVLRDEDLVETTKTLARASQRTWWTLTLRRLVRSLRRQRILQLAGKVRWGRRSLVGKTRSATAIVDTSVWVHAPERSRSFEGGPGGRRETGGLPGDHPGGDPAGLKERRAVPPVRVTYRPGDFTYLEMRASLYSTAPRERSTAYGKRRQGDPRSADCLIAPVESPLRRRTMQASTSRRSISWSASRETAFAVFRGPRRGIPAVRQDARTHSRQCRRARRA